VKLPDAQPIDSQYLAEFEEAAAPLIRQLDSIRPMRVAESGT